ncbi:hypothetical protein IFM89_018387 [Coptis chinensis]|uniref:Uncharacterized protein n=1 Tax=Coptis chinensis TaxID=261450 RepID=A0A835HMX7_9MAGN|nr:hypothetical protein IFM89_018387 [Coptis chinensis]
METLSSVKETDEVGYISCWSRFKLKFPWSSSSSTSSNYYSRQRSILDFNFTKASCTKQRKPKGGFQYDPISYAQNFDEGSWDGDSEDSYRGFSSKSAAPVPKQVLHH